MHNSTTGSSQTPVTTHTSSFVTPSNCQVIPHNKGTPKCRTCSEYEIINWSPAEAGPYYEELRFEVSAHSRLSFCAFPPFYMKGQNSTWGKIKYIKIVVSKWNIRTLQWYRTKQRNYSTKSRSFLKTAAVNFPSGGNLYLPAVYFS